MGDPVTTGILVGAAMGGGGAALKGQDPLKGALIGGATGGIGGGFAGGFSGAAGTPASGIMGTGAGFAGNNLAAAPTFMQQLSGGAMGVKDVLGGANTFANQNPITTQLGMQTASNLMQPDQPIPYAPQGQVQRGQIAPMDYMSLLNPQNQSVMRPQPISLL
jgi:hypothetical protein